MRQGGGQATPDPPAPGSPPPPPRRRVRWWRLVLPLPLLGLGVWGWLRPTEAWLGLVLALLPVVNLAMARDQREVPEWARPRWMVAWAIGYGLLVGAAAPVGAWLAR